MRVRKKAWTVAEYDNNPHLIHNPTEHKGKWKELFKNDNPIYLEIGCGKGRFISQNAQKFKDINFIGVERQSTIVATAARNVGPEAENVFLIHGDVENLLDFFEPGEIKRLYIISATHGLKRNGIKDVLLTDSFLINTESFLVEKVRYSLKQTTEYFLSSRLTNSVPMTGSFQT